MAAVAMGSRIVEQHFTTDRGLWGPDHKVSMTPDEFKKMTDAIRSVEGNVEKQQAVLSDAAMQKYMGKEEKFLQEGEVPFRGLFRKSLVASRDLAAGAVLSAEDIYAMRPQQLIGGLPSEKYEEVIGKTISQSLKKYDPITTKSLAA